MLELQRDRSIELTASFEVLKCVGWLLLSKTKSGSSKSFSIFLPLMSVCLDPQRELWLLKSPSRIKGLGSWSISYSS